MSASSCSLPTPQVILPRAAGAIVGLACGDTLGVPHELAPAPTADQPLSMSGGGLGPYAPGEWSDETQLAVCLLEVTAAGGDMRSKIALDTFARRLFAWSCGSAGKPRDMGVFTSQVLFAAHELERPENAWKLGSQAKKLGIDPEESLSPSERLALAALSQRQLSRRLPAADTLSLAPVMALFFLNDAPACSSTCRELGLMLTADPMVSDGLAFLAEVIRHAIVSPSTGVWHERIDFRSAIEAVSSPERKRWSQIVEESLARFFQPPRDNGYVQAALSAAICAVYDARWESSRVTRQDAFQIGVEAAVRIGGDTDTVAGLTGAILGSAGGIESIPGSWIKTIHGWPGLDAEGLCDLAQATALVGLSGGGLEGAQRAMDALVAIKTAPRLEKTTFVSNSSPEL
ncbi:ADP-ribosylglycohydrolase family protein [Actinomycetaceae bacterium TAE3-ERU4]|nr:ADP-ribosylglycohydrolase family protein [Actinomycetaceae bacterium TAE3-ERU4]